LITAREQYQDELLEIKQKEEEDDKILKEAQLKARQKELHRVSICNLSC
jgi:hypothetical protein